MKYLPIFIDLKNKPVLVIGGGLVAFRKIQMLQKTGAFIQVVAFMLCPNLNKFFYEKKIIWIGKKFIPSMMDGMFLVIAATDNSDLNNIIFRNAEERRILVNTVDDQSKCSFIFPAIIDRSPVLIGISSCGTAPVLIRILREKLESLLPTSIGYVSKLAGIWRKIVKKRIKNVIHRRQFWEKLFYNGQVSLFLEQGNIKKANNFIRAKINSSSKLGDNKIGNVILVGAGPGDVGLLTIRGLQVMQQADVILYDHLVNPDILNLARRDANKICVGKFSGKHSISQDKLNHLIIQLAQQGNSVVRLKGGDSFIFGRGGEELQQVSKAGISFQVVPGITAAIGSAAYAGIPLTHREYSHGVIFITGHKSIIDNENHYVDWRLLSNNNQTLVIYMGKFNAMNISKNLIFYGRHINTPVAIISRGTYQNQKVLIGTLVELERLVCMSEKPMLLIIGNVVTLHKEMNWFGMDTQINNYNF